MFFLLLRRKENKMSDNAFRVFMLLFMGFCIVVAAIVLINIVSISEKLNERISVEEYNRIVYINEQLREVIFEKQELIEELQYQLQKCH